VLRRTCAIVALLGPFAWAVAGPAPGASKAVQFVVIVPDLAADQPARIFLASSADGWDERGRSLEKIAPGVYGATFDFDAAAPLEYKFTRTGSWATVEKLPTGQELANRLLTVDPALNEQIVVHRVARWADRPPPERRRIEFPATADVSADRPATSTLTGTIRFHHPFRSPQLDNERSIAVYLPPGYDEEPDVRYPVVYLHDGNNVFDAQTSFAGVEWRADETAEELIRAGRLPKLILVGIYNTPERIGEYTPFADGARGGGRGEQYLAFIVETLKPFIDKTYRTRPEREHTGIVGASLGGLIALYAPYRFPDVFGQAAAMSPTLMWADAAILRYVAQHPPAKKPRLWIDMDTSSDANSETATASPYVAAGRELVRTLKAAGVREGVDFHYEEIPGGRHHETDWARRFDRVLVFLFGPSRPD